MKIGARYLTTEQRRSALKLAYSDRNWISKIDKMPSNQVYAIFDKLKKEGIINFDDNGNVYFKSREEVNKMKEKRSGYHQITLDEYLKERNSVNTNGKNE